MFLDRVSTVKVVATGHPQNTGLQPAPSLSFPVPQDGHHPSSSLDDGQRKPGKEVSLRPWPPSGNQNTVLV